MNKFISLLLAGLFTASITACNTPQTTNLPQATDLLQTEKVSTYSDVGLEGMLSAFVYTTFKFLDKDKNNFLTLNEYKSMYQPSPAPSELPALPESKNTDKLLSQIQNLSEKSNITTDPTARFNILDKDKDAKLTLSEVNSQMSYFLPSHKETVRKEAKKGFEGFDLNKDKFISRDEFFRFKFGDASLNIQKIIFIKSDLNNDSSLDFSEFEDIVYSAFRASLEDLI